MPDGRNLPRLEIVELAREEAQANLKRVFESIQSSGVLEAMKRVQDVGEQLAKDQQRVRDMLTLPTLAYQPEVYIAPPRQKVVDEDRLARKVSREVIGHFERQKFDPTSKIVTLMSTRDEIVRQTLDGVKRIPLTTRQRALLAALSNEFTSTERLVAVSGYKNETTLRQAIGTLREKVKAVFELEDLPIYGEEGRGYRIADGYSIMIDR